MDGVFKFYSSISGLSLDVIVEYLNDSNCVVDWMSFVEDAISSGWSIKNVIDKIEMAFSDLFMDEYKTELIKRVKMYLVSKDK